jgi:8-oxo-dGTP pyrophosphatase MutT (NUDIX family)
VAERGQYAALPYIQVAGDLRICLITSRETKRWVIPKGWPKAGLRPHELAAQEAVEEAGLIGDIASDPIGTYSYSKRLHFFSSVTCQVSVFPLLVHTQRVHWREESERKLAWMSPAEAAQNVREPELSRLLAALPHWVGERVPA